MSNALHGVVLSDSIQGFTQYSGIPRITSIFSAFWDVSYATNIRLCDIVMKNQALYLKWFRDILMIRPYRRAGEKSGRECASDKKNLVFWGTFGE